MEKHTVETKTIREIAITTNDVFDSLDSVPLEDHVSTYYLDLTYWTDIEFSDDERERIVMEVIRRAVDNDGFSRWFDASYYLDHIYETIREAIDEWVSYELQEIIGNMVNHKED